MSLATGTVEGVEALVRWEHPTRGTLAPATFIPIAEATGLIIALGRWVVAEACRAAAALQAGRPSPLLMHVNLSPRQLYDPTLVNLVEQTLDDAALAPELLVLEVTEGVLVDNDTLIQRLHELHALGVRIAIDDFGTGYTSINYLQRLPVDIVKIDRSFISGDALPASERSAFLHAVLGLARSLNLQTVAEGVEDAAQLADLHRLGCDAGQGYWWARPHPESMLPSTIATIDSMTLGRR